MSNNKKLPQMTAAQKMAYDRKRELRYQKGEMKGKEKLDYSIERKFLTWNDSLKDKDKYLKITPNKVYGGVLGGMLIFSSLLAVGFASNTSGEVSIESDYSYVYVTNEYDEYLSGIYKTVQNYQDELIAVGKTLGITISETDFEKYTESESAFKAACNDDTDFGKVVLSEEFLSGVVGLIVEQEVTALTVLQNEEIKEYIVTKYGVLSNVYDVTVATEDSLNAFLGNSDNSNFIVELQEDKKFAKLFQEVTVELGGDVEEVSIDLSSDYSVVDVSDLQDTAYSSVETGGYLVSKEVQESSDENAAVEGREVIQLNGISQEEFETINNTLRLYSYDTFAQNADEIAPAQLVLFTTESELEENLALRMFLLDLYSSGSTADIKLKTVLYDVNDTFEDFGFAMEKVSGASLVKFNNYGDGVALDSQNVAKTYTFSSSLNSNINLADGDGTVLETSLEDSMSFFNENIIGTGMTSMSHSTLNESILDITRIFAGDDEEL